MSIFGQVVTNINEGREGRNKGLPMGFDRLVEYLPNIQKKTYYVIGAKAKIGKTTFTDDCFLYNPFEYLMSHPEENIDMDVDYFSFEVDKHTKITRGITRKLFKDYGVYVDTNYVLSKGKNRISQELYDKVIECRDYFDKLEDVITIQDIPEKASSIYSYLLKKINGYGKSYWTTKTLVDEFGQPFQRRVFDKFIPYNKNKYHIVILDHIGLVPTASSQTTKAAIDELSHYLIELRNNYHIIPVVVQQLAFGNNEEVGNFGAKSSRPPKLNDFGDSKYTTRDANVIIALHNPNEDNVKLYNNYDISRLGNNYRDLIILANREGEPNVSIGLLYYTKAGMFKELPRPDDQDGLNRVYNELSLINA